MPSAFTQHFRSEVVGFDYPPDGVVEIPALPSNGAMVHQVTLTGPRVDDAEQLAHQFGFRITSSTLQCDLLPRQLLERGHLHMMGGPIEHRPFGHHDAAWTTTTTPDPSFHQVCVTANGYLHLISWGAVTQPEVQNAILSTVTFGREAAS